MGDRKRLLFASDRDRIPVVGAFVVPRLDVDIVKTAIAKPLPHVGSFHVETVDSAEVAEPTHPCQKTKRRFERC